MYHIRYHFEFPSIWDGSESDYIFPKPIVSKKTIESEILDNEIDDDSEFFNDLLNLLSYLFNLIINS